MSIRPLYIAGSVAPLVGAVPGVAVVLDHTVELIAIIVAVILLLIGWFRRRRRGRRARDATAGPKKPGEQDRVGKQESPARRRSRLERVLRAPGGRTRVPRQGPDAGGVGRARKRLNLK